MGRDAKRAEVSLSIQNPLADWSRNFHLCHRCSVISCFEKFGLIHDPEKNLFYKFYSTLMKQQSFRLFPWLPFSTTKEPFSIIFFRWSQDNGEGGERWCWKGQESEAAGRVWGMGGGLWLAQKACKVFPSVYYEIGLTMKNCHNLPKLNFHGSLRYIIYYNNGIWC